MKAVNKSDGNNIYIKYVRDEKNYYNQYKAVKK